MKAKRSKISQEDVKPKDDFLPLQEKKIYNFKTKFEKNALLGSMKNDKRRREVSTRLTFTQPQTFALSRKDLLQPLKHSKAIKDLSFKFLKLEGKDVRILEEAISMKRSSLTSISISISHETDLKILKKLMNLMKKFSSLQKIHLKLHLRLWTNWDYGIIMNNSACRKLVSSFKKIAKLKDLHFDFTTNANESKIEFMNSLVPYFHKQNRLEALGLNLSTFDEIPDKDFKKFLESLEQLQSLQTFRFKVESSHNNRAMTDSRIKKLCSHIKKFKNLQILDLDFVRSSVSNIGITPLAVCLKQFPLLHTLNLNFARSGSVTAECLKTLSSGLVKIPHLRNLRFDLSGLFISGNGDGIIINLSKGLASLTGLTSFSLRLVSKNSSLKDEGFIQLGKSLQKLEGLKSLSLVIPDCENVTSEGVKGISKGIEKLTLLQNLELSFTKSPKVNGEALISVLQAVSCCKSLKDLALDFSRCEIIDQDLQALPSIFKKLDFLQKLAFNVDRQCMELKDIGFFALCRCIPHLISLRHLQIVFSFGSPDAILGLKDVFVKLPLLKSIDFENPYSFYSDSRYKSLQDIQKSFPFKQINIIPRTNYI